MIRACICVSFSIQQREDVLARVGIAFKIFWEYLLHGARQLFYPLVENSTLLSQLEKPFDT